MASNDGNENRNRKRRRRRRRSPSPEEIPRGPFPLNAPPQAAHFHDYFQGAYPTYLPSGGRPMSEVLGTAPVQYNFFNQACQDPAHAELTEEVLDKDKKLRDKDGELRRAFDELRTCRQDLKDTDAALKTAVQANSSAGTRRRSASHLPRTSDDSRGRVAERQRNDVPTETASDHSSNTKRKASQVFSILRFDDEPDTYLASVDGSDESYELLKA
ncbi:hypothetical protein F53441_4223 [Fusarium austroafricanum]|uniref:Uncharacterized protein n=1 Tax=Fusarium austroafricanum TaxID=2364996 RepID=A0A8H4KKR2_9HYPO|nr:hypothetical protein F53441_4223 [Fusarium austroafricanum]